MSFLDSAAEHWRENADAELHEVKVPELGESVWFKSTAGMTGNEFTKYMKMVQSEAFDERIVDQLILRGRNEDGTKKFRPADKKQLMTTVDPYLLGRIVNDMARIDNEAEDKEKKG